MDYQNTLKYLYESAPMFQQIGGKAYKPGLETTYKLDEYFGHPHQQFKTIHIAGTNGKGSCSHTIAAVLQSAGYRVGLYTSPHLIDFRERIRIDGQMIPEEYVVNFVEEHRSFFEPLHPSFFELTTAMAFRYFADQKVDIAIIEAGMGGRLDCTNIIHPEVSVITNISFDHMQYLGDTLTKIAKEKAGIIKEGVPVVIGKAEGHVKRVFTMKAQKMNTTIKYGYPSNPYVELDWIPYAEMRNVRNAIDDIQQKYFDRIETVPEAAEVLKAWLLHLQPGESVRAADKIIDKRKDAIRIVTPDFAGGLFMELNGIYQFDNIYTILTVLSVLVKKEYRITSKDYFNGFADVCKYTGMIGRWQKVHSYPDIFCDTGHNADAIERITIHLEHLRVVLHRQIHIVFGMAKDKEVEKALEKLPKEATYYFTKASVERALPEDELLKLAEKVGLKGTAYPTVVEAVKAAKKNCPPQEFIFVGGSTFIVADLLTNSKTLNLH